MIALLIFVLAWAIPAIIYARADVRDDLRKTDISTLKHALEQYNNVTGQYVAAPPGQTNCTSSAEANSWLFGNSSLLKQKKILTAMPHDLREPVHQYRYCVTDTQNHQVTSYFLEAQLEAYQADQIGFDEDEARKYAFRILNDHGRTLYRVCGGAETQCGTGSSS